MALCRNERRGLKWCPWRESNPHSLRNTILSRARLPVPPHGLKRMIRKSGDRFSGKIMRQEIPFLYIVAMRPRLSRANSTFEQDVLLAPACSLCRWGKGRLGGLIGDIRKPPRPTWSLSSQVELSPTGRGKNAASLSHSLASARRTGKLPQSAGIESHHS